MEIMWGNVVDYINSILFCGLPLLKTIAFVMAIGAIKWVVQLRLSDWGNVRFSSICLFSIVW